ncbi:MAG: F0F1 ATP synthase subunit delta [Pseudomonadales bacterium]|nr:F0F1 ATP synthase subunit delta [Pseudomonadales bacterium]
MAELATIARPYANAVFSLAKREVSLNMWSSMLSVIAATSDHPSVSMLLASPDLAGSAKAFRLAEICGDGLDDRGKKFLQALADNDRLDLLGEIRVQFEDLRAEEEKSLDVEVVSAYEMSDVQSEALKVSLNQKFEKEITIETRVDANLIGGAVIRAGDVVIDGSVRGKLAKLAETLTAI